MARTTYSDEQKREALRIYEESGPAEAARQTKINRSTISKWASRAGVVTGARQNKEAIAASVAQAAAMRAKLRPLLLEKATMLIGRLTEETPAADTRPLATSAAILIDKLRLEEGQATSRDERITQTDFDREVGALVDQVKGLA